MTATLSMVPLAQIRPSKAQPARRVRRRADGRADRVREAARDHHAADALAATATAATRSSPGSAATARRRRRSCREVPAQVREVDGEALTLAVAENVIRADLSPLEEARAYRRLVDEHGDAAKVAKLVGKSERLIGERLDLLRLPDETQDAARGPPGAARLRARARPDRGARAAARRPRRPHGSRSARRTRRASRPHPGEVVDDVLAAEWHDDDGQPLHPVAYSVGGYHGPILPRPRPRGRARGRAGEARRARARRSRRPSARCPRSRTPPSTTGRRASARSDGERDCFALSDDDADAARAFGCLLELPAPDGRARSPLRHRPGVARGSARAEDRRPRRGGGGAQAARSARHARRAAGGDDAEKEARREERERDYEARVAARARNLDLGAALARWEPKLDTDAVKLLGSLVLARTTARRRRGRTGSASSSRRRRTSRAR